MLLYSTPSMVIYFPVQLPVCEKSKNLAYYYRQMKGVFYYRNHTYSFNSLQLVFFIFTLLLLALIFYDYIFYAPGSNDLGNIVFVLSVCLSVVNFNICCNF